MAESRTYVITKGLSTVPSVSTLSGGRVRVDWRSNGVLISSEIFSATEFASFRKFLNGYTVVTPAKAVASSPKLNATPVS